MDTEEDIEIQHKLRAGLPQTDEGPYYHESWWEAYKGSVKGKLGGGVIGALLGALVGGLAVGLITLAAPWTIAAATGWAITGGLAAAGMAYGSHEFSDVGKVTGAVAAAHEKSEERMKSYEDGKFSEIKRDIGDIKRMLGGKASTPEASPDNAQKIQKDEEYRSQHSGQRGPQKLVFWHIALIGLAIGLAAGALLVATGGAAHILASVGVASGVVIPKASLTAASMTIMGLIGASFGINRDAFRQIFDKTDLLFKGIIANYKERQTARAQEIDISTGKTTEFKEPPVNTIMYDAYPDYPQSETYHRDKVLASAKQALLSMDHTKSVPH